MAYNKQTWKDEIPDLTKPIKDASGKQKTDPQTGRPLYELVQEGTRITSARLNHIEDGVEGAHAQMVELSEDIDTHASDGVKHLTAAERTAWNAKETPAAAQQKADASLASAKSYTDTQLLTKADKSTTYSKAETDQRIQVVVGAAPAALDTLKEIGDALNNDPNFAATMTTQLSGKVDKVAGKQLSTEDFSTSEKAKLAGLTTGAGGAGSANDTVVGTRTISDTTAPTGDSGTITTLFGWLANMIKSITGKASWRTAPATTLEAAKAHADDTTRHLTAAERTAWNAMADASQLGRVDLTQTLGPGTSVVTADQNGSELDLVVQGRTLVNLLGNLGNFEVDSNNDGRADGLSIGMPATYSRVAGKYGAFAQRIASSASETSADRRVSLLNIAVPAGKYVVIADGMTDGTNGRMGISVYNNGSTVGVTTAMSNPGSWKPVYTKFTLAADTTTLALHFYNTATAGAVGWVQFDGAGLYQVDDALYARIGVDITEANIRDYMPHVDGKQHVQGVVVTKQGRNLLPGTPDTIHANAKMNGPYSFTLSPTAIYQSSLINVSVLPNTTYSFRVTEAGGNIWERKADKVTSNGGVAFLAGVVRTITTKADTVFLQIEFTSAQTSGTVNWKDWMLVVGDASSLPTAFTPAEPQSVTLPVTLGQIGDVRDRVYSAGAEWLYIEKIKKGIQLDGSLLWAFSTDYAGYRSVYTTSYSAGGGGSGINLQTLLTKYDGTQIRRDSATTVNSMTGANLHIWAPSSVCLTISDADSGWTETLNPSTNAVKALMNGWRATANNGTLYTSWVSIVDGEEAPANSEAWVSTNIARGWAGWATLDYVLASAAAPVPVPNAEGSITLHPGGNQLSVETGVIQREKANPVLSSNLYFINHTPAGSASLLLHRPLKMLAVYKGDTPDPKWVLDPTSAGAAYFPTDGLMRAYVRSAADYDSSATYYVTYIALDNYALTANVTEAAATWRSGLGGVVSELVQSTAELRQENDRQDFADDYIEAKVDNLKLGVSDGTALPSTIQKHQLTQNSGTLFQLTTGSAGAQTATRMYTVATGAVTDLPVASTGILEVIGSLQRFTEVPSLRTWKRRINSGSWNAWVEDENASRKNVAGGYGGLDSNAKQPRNQAYSQFTGQSQGTVMDFNTVLTPGVYTATSSAANHPDTGNYGVLVNYLSTGEVHDNAVNWLFQTFYGTNGKVYARNKTNAGPFSAWGRIYDSRTMGAGSGLDADLHAGKTLAEVVQGSLSYLGPLGGNSPNFTGSANPPIAALAPGQRLSFKALQSTSGPITLNVNGLGAKSIKKPNGNNPPLVQGGVYTVVYDGTAFILQGEGGEYGTAGPEQVLEGYTVGTEDGIVEGQLWDLRDRSTGLYMQADVDSPGTLELYAPISGNFAINVGSLFYLHDDDFIASNIKSGVNIFGLQGTMPVITDGADPAQGVGKWGDGALAVYPREGYRKGGAGAGEIKVTPAQLQSAEPGLSPGNIRSGVSIYGINGNLAPVKTIYNPGNTAPTAVSGYAIDWNVSITTTPGKVLSSVIVECSSDSSNFVTSSLAPNSRFHLTAGWSFGGSTSGPTVSLQGGSITCSLLSMNYNASTGSLSFIYRVGANGAAGGTLSYVGSASRLITTFVLI